MQGRIYTAILLTLSISVAFADYDWSQNPGNGEISTPYQISTPQQLTAIGSNPTLLTKSFVLTADIDLTGQPFTSAVIAPDTDPAIGGFQGSPFSGRFNGNHHTISRLNIDAYIDYLGLFGYIGNGGQVLNLTMTAVALKGNSVIGALAGYINNGSVTQCHAQGTFQGEYAVAGLIGMLQTGTIRDSDADVTVNGYSLVGGLVGLCSPGTLILCSSQGRVEGAYDVGGLVGISRYGTVRLCSSRAEVFGQEYAEYVGGLIGENFGGIVEQCRASGPVSGDSDSSFVGGLVGENYEGLILSSASSGPVTGQYSIGGLVGVNANPAQKPGFGEIRNSYSTSTVTALAGANKIGGLAGWNWQGLLSHCYSSGTVTAAAVAMGAFLGTSDEPNSIIDSCYALTTAGPDNNLGTLLTDARMKQQASYAGWEFLGQAPNNSQAPWRMCADNTAYPKLAWEYSLEGDFACPDGTGFEDLAELSKAWLTAEGQPAYVSPCDMNADQAVNLDDLAVFSGFWLTGR